MTTRLAVLTLMAFAVVAPAAAGCDDDERPGTPHSLKATPLSSGGITLQWSSNVGHYDIYIFDKAGRPVPEAPNITGGATNRNYLEIYGLKPDKEYFFSMRARSEGGTQGCVSKNASEIVSAKTDTADLNKVCSNYEKTAQENIRAMRGKGCPLPGSAYSGIWATQPGAHFTYCLQQKRARLQGDANAQWERNRDLRACDAKAAKCWSYAGSATTAELANRELKCGYTGPRWSVFISAHFSWCMSPSTTLFSRTVEAKARNRLIRACKAKKAEEAKGGGGGGSCATPAEWTDMLKAHNDERAKHCGGPLTWNCDLAKGAQEYADKCILDAHGNPEGIGENLADMWNNDDSYPAGKDQEAFEAVWGCERELYNFTNPVRVGGFKENCLAPPAGPGVNGHFTQVVWRSTTQLGCARAKCPIKDKEGNIHQGTHWVCRYGPGGNDDTKLAQNVQKSPNCTTQAFRSRSVATCLRGMVQTASGDCACPPGTSWNRRACAEPPRKILPAQPPPPPVCEGDRPVGVPPNCCPRNMHFERGVCRRDVINNGRPDGGTQGTKPGGAVSCPADRPVGTPPNNCCPVNTHFERGVCRRDVINTGRPDGGTRGTKPGGDDRRKCPSGTIGRYPRCRCPQGMTGSPPNCCPPGTRYQNGKCIRPQPTGPGNDGASGTKSCPPGTHSTRSGQCVENPAPTQKPPPTPSKTEPKKKQCTGGRIGRPPRCHCPAGTRLMGGWCRSIPKPAPAPTPTGPTPKKQCSGGKVPRSTDGACVCPNGTSDRGGQCVDAVR